MNAPQKITSWVVAPGVALVHPAPRIDARARKHAARWLKAMRARGSKPRHSIRDLLREIQR